MESTASVSKGVFLFSNGFKKSKNKKKSNKSLFESKFVKVPWYTRYRSNWSFIEENIKKDYIPYTIKMYKKNIPSVQSTYPLVCKEPKELHHRTYSVLLNDIVNYINTFNGENFCTLEGIIPSATLLTGVNQPDHVSQFMTLRDKIRDEVTPHIAIIISQDALTVKNFVENAVWQLCHEDEAMDVSDNDDVEDETRSKKMKKSNCTMKTLQNWYYSKYFSPKKKSKNKKRPLVVIMPDFESFNCHVLQDFVLIVSSYMTSLPIVFIFGVATSVSALHKSFPYHVSSKLLIKVFHSHSSPLYMNQVLEDIFLIDTSPFHLSGKTFELLTDVFLFYDFSVTGLIQSIKYCMMDHYYNDNIKSLCCPQDEIKGAVNSLSSEDLENVRQLMSFRPFSEVQDCETVIALFEDDDFFREVLCKEIVKLHEYLYSFYACVRLLLAFVKDIPKNIIGRTVREIYTRCATEYVTSTPGFKECMQLINFQSQIKLTESIKNALKVVNLSLQNASPLKPLSTPTKSNMKIVLSDELGINFVKNIRVHLMTFLRQIENANTEATIGKATMEGDNESENFLRSRYKLKEKLLKATRFDKIQSEYEMIRSRFLSYLEEMFTKGLQPPHTQTFHEILFFDDIASVKKHIVGAPRGAVHTALSNPANYLQCSCCNKISTESVSDTLPDVCIVYKLHRECGKHINLYDWLQAFATVLRPEEEDDQRHQDTSVQVRFTRAVAELQFLGFIKSSKRKTDHVMRLTW